MQTEILNDPYYQNENYPQSQKSSSHGHDLIDELNSNLNIKR